MKQITDMAAKPSRPLRVLQFGEGVFLRAFADWMIDIANETGDFCGDIVMVKPRPGAPAPAFVAQDCLYTVALRGKAEGSLVDSRRIVTSVRKLVDAHANPAEFFAIAEEPALRFVLSNTTEAGIRTNPADGMEEMPVSFPGKAARLLFARWKAFHGAADKGLIFLPTELIENNGDTLKGCILSLAAKWSLPAEFIAWVEESCIFANTLVDRIVTGYGEGLCDYADALADIAEPFAFWAIESERDISEEFPLHRAGLPVVFTRDLAPYRERKVRLLNGAHTSTVLLGWLLGCETVSDCMKDAELRAFMERAVLGEILPWVPLPRSEAEGFAKAVFERFENPFLHHSVLAISLNSVSKWKARVLPSLRDAYAEKSLPRALIFSFAALLAFYSSPEAGHALRADGVAYELRDEAENLAFFAENSGKCAKEYARAAAENAGFWGENLAEYPEFVALSAKYLENIRTCGARRALQAFLED